ncbi:glutamate-gated chloride channel-like [Parasteatoda tepidariorum]|uniref:glutamate-gated chloride channel-like n=1 Tax=Parasteatoda tepidariorum TaxID=114398 RepID=UPI00077FC7F5|nr:glutamate-gated chloride channel-like [Parasteatoda tepidariorum]XP_042908315.1 glutamate-gated chloride channel-like [Parasteatoda tepidariorum]XP_042908316.1 glutamate-gated chloride channel-like [Parasteatoda tepidariorum]XP_042908317.1 glutamate-gated chloride channel-like [Parasteatoda tepidariorum]
MCSWLPCLLAVLALSMPFSSVAQQPDDIPRFESETDKEILDAILDRKRYDFRMRPNNKTEVNVTVLILSLSSPDESSLKYEVEFLLHQSWDDPRLKYEDSGKYRYLNAISHYQVLWTPDIYFIKHGEFKAPLAQVHMALKIFNNGSVRYITRRSMILNCQGNLQIFPFDNPKCPFAIESVSHEISELELRWEKQPGGVSGATSLRYHNAYLVKNETGICDSHDTWRGEYSCLRVLLVFTRDKIFYFSTVFAPGVVLVTSSFISFWLDINAVPARVMIGVTTMLNFCTTTNSFRSTLPVVSNLTAMNLWDGVCMFFIYASMLEFIIVNYLYRKYPKRPSIGASGASSSLGRWCGTFEQSSALKDNNSNDPRGGAQVPRDGDGAGHRSLFGWLKRQPIYPHSRQRLSKVIDNVSKILFPLSFGLFVLGYFLTYAIIKPTHSENWELLSNGYTY